LGEVILGINVAEAVDRLRDRATRLAEEPPPPIVGVPLGETTRSPAAAVVADAASTAGLFLFHFEHRAPQDLPDEWVLEGQEAAAQPPDWVSGIRPERKYQSFRHDQGIGSFHPHHRAKWSTHELLHGLVGCAWTPDASPFFHATAGRLAELLPVALWYFFDEAFLGRCSAHAGDGALFRTTCDRCEAGASVDLTAGGDWVREGLRFVDRELAAVAQSRRVGDVIPHRWATINLASDGVAYARAHGVRLRSPEMHTYARMLPEGYRADSLDALEGRVVEVLQGLLGDGIAASTRASAEWARDDLAWRLLMVRAQTDGEARDMLDAIVDSVEAGAPFGEVAGAYRTLHSEWELPAPDEVFAVGYPLKGVPSTSQAFVDGLRTGLPKIDWVVGEELDGLADGFAAADLEAPDRRALALRFADHLAKVRPELADAARFEGSVSSLPMGATAALPQSSADGRVRAAPGVRVLSFETDAAEKLDALERGSPPKPSGPTAYLCGRDAHREPLLVDIDPAWVAGLRSEEGIELDVGTAEALGDLGLTEPVVRAE
jgi:hypothetical protein